MFGFGKKKSRDSLPSDLDQADEQRRTGLFARLKTGLSKTRNGLTGGVSNLLRGRKQIDDELLEELETQLITADVGVEATQSIIADLTRRVARKQLGDADALMGALHDDMRAMLEPVSQPLQIPASDQPFVLLMVGINGAGKTTTIGKIARLLKNQGCSVMLAAGDTFRAAAVEQLALWGERLGIEVIRQGTGADPAAVVFDAVNAGRAGPDTVVFDTSLHTLGDLRAGRFETTFKDSWHVRAFR